LAAVPAGATGPHHARRVAHLAHRRRVAEAGQTLAQSAEDLSVDVDDAVAEATDRLAHQRRVGAVVDPDRLVDEALTALDRGDAPLGWGAPWRPAELAWRIVPGWLHVVIGHRSAGKSALVDALLVGLVEEHDVRPLLWSPEGAPSGEHLLRLAQIQAGRVLRDGASAVQHCAWAAERVRWMDHESHTTTAQILAAADAHRTRHRLDVLVVDPFTSVDKFQGDEPWDRMLNRNLSRLQGWARSRSVAVVVIAHPKQRDRLPSGVRPVATDADIHGGIMWGNQTDSLVSVWRDEQGVTRPAEQVDVHVQKVRHDGPGGLMGRKVTLQRDGVGRYHPVLREAGHG